VSVDAVVYYRVSNATVSIANVENAHHSTRLLAQTTLRNTMGTRQLHEILSERMTISGSMQVSKRANKPLIYHETKLFFSSSSFP
jgi:erythrocyte band 7 integral membrane protein